ncbi:hypothetical protein [Kitasatospora kifunensis]|uniref:Transcriptional regulator n=1 Tax=Kitasatospora kifunensis TaxID=58351 RepID=A0A7W7RB88_KITKI|nr:hypothetical protein [Kitasatospora kifunensis]MBB4928670.1 hypothetical protein [Kitasatospora kifunensis]
MPGHDNALRHPLARLRKQTGDSQLDFADRVATAHERLGFGYVGSYRKKVSRWENWQATPSMPAQYAMAEIFRIPRDKVWGLGWPRWLHLATGDAGRLSRPWTSPDTVDALLEADRPTLDSPATYLTVTGPDVTYLTESWHRALAHRPPVVPCPQRRIDARALTALDAHVQALEAMLATVDPRTLLSAARGSLAVMTGLLRASGYDQPTASRLHLLAARSAEVCAVLMNCLGNGHRAEHYLLAAIRSATNAGASQAAAMFMGELASLHLDLGAPKDAFAMADSALAATARIPGPQCSAFLYSRRARAQALLGGARAALRDLDLAHAALSSGPEDQAPSVGPDLGIDEQWLTVQAGAVWLHLGQPGRALERLAPLISSASALPSYPYFQVPRRALVAIDAQLATGELDAAVHTARWALDTVGSMPPAFVSQYQQRFTGHRTPATRELRERLTASDHEMY